MVYGGGWCIIIGELTSYYPAKEGNKMKLTYTPRDVPAKGGVPAVFDTKLPWLRHDGGREMAGYRGSTGDCGSRGLSLAVGAFTDTPVEGPLYRRVYQAIADGKRVLYETPSDRGGRCYCDSVCLPCARGASDLCVCDRIEGMRCRYHRASASKQTAMRSPRAGTPVPVIEDVLAEMVGVTYSWSGGSFDRGNGDIQEGVVLCHITTGRKGSHISTLIDGVIHDTWHPQFSRRGGGEWVTDPGGSRNWTLTTPLSRYPKIIKAWRMGSRDTTNDDGVVLAASRPEFEAVMVSR